MRLQKRKLFLNLMYGLAILLVPVLLITSVSLSNNNQYVTECIAGQTCSSNSIRLAGTQCGGSSNNPVTTSIDFGCRGVGNPITDMLFALVRFLSAGVGVVIVLSVIIGGIQYIVSRGDPNATQAAINRLVSAVTALIVFIFAYAILNFVIPGGFFN